MLPILNQGMIDLKYVTLLSKHKMNGKEHNYQRRVWSKVYTRALMIINESKKSFPTLRE